MLAVTLLPAACKTHRHHPARLAEAADSELFVPQTGGSRRALLSADGSSYDHRTRCSTPSSAAQTRQWPLPAPSKASAHLWSRRLNAFVTSIVCASWRALGNDPKRTLLLNRYAAPDHKLASKLRGRSNFLWREARVERPPGGHARGGRRRLRPC